MVNALVGFNGMLPAIPAVVGSTAFAMLALSYTQPPKKK